MPHATPPELEAVIARARAQVEVGAAYAHYRHPEDRYLVEAVGLIEATQEACVIYRPAAMPDVRWVRPLSDWLATVTDDHGATVPRFKKAVA